MELEGEKMKRRVMNQFDDDKFKMEQEQQDNLTHVKETFDKKIQISKQKREVKNDKLYEVESAE